MSSGSGRLCYEFGGTVAGMELTFVSPFGAGRGLGVLGYIEAVLIGQIRSGSEVEVLEPGLLHIA